MYCKHQMTFLKNVLDPEIQLTCGISGMEPWTCVMSTCLHVSCLCVGSYHRCSTEQHTGKCLPEGLPCSHQQRMRVPLSLHRYHQNAPLTFERQEGTIMDDYPFFKNTSLKEDF